MTPNKSKPAILPVCLALLFLVVQSAAAQAVYGTIRGSVVDASGLVIVGAKVSAANQNTREVRVVSTNESGEFVIPSLIPGPYTVTAEAQGFKKYEKTGVNLTTQERLDVGPLAMQVGAVTESVVVTAEATPVQTASSERVALVTGRQMEELPILSRHISAFMRMIPAAVEQYGSDDYAWQTDGTSPTPHLGGINAKYNSLALDGISLIEDGSDGWPNAHVNPDAIAEVKVLVNNYQAEYGRNGGAAVNMVTKGGTQDFHGAAYTFWRHEQFNSKNFFENYRGDQKQRDRYRMYGYNVGGPVYLPGKFNTNKDKLFFFWSQERIRSKGSESQQRTVPTDLERAGDFSQTLDTGNNMPIINDPLTQAPFPDNKIPTTRFNQQSAKLLTIFPAANFFDRAISGGNYNFKTDALPTENRNDEYILRLDYNVSDKLRTYFRGIRYIRQQEHPWDVMFPTWAGINVTDDYRTIGGVLSASYTVSPTLVNEFSFGAKGHKRYTTDYDETALNKFTRSALSFTVGQFHPEINPLDLLPRLNFGGVPNAANLNFDGRFPMKAMYQDYSLTDGLTKVWHSHTLKFGLDFKYTTTKNGDSGTFAGNFYFDRSTTNPLDSGWAYANALLGNFYAYQESTSRPRQFDYTRTLEWYAQDNWRVNKKLTLDYGMRFSIRWPDWVPTGEVAAFDPQTWNASSRPVMYQPVLNGAGQRVGQNPLTGELVPAVMIGGLVPDSGNFVNGMVVGTDANYPRGFRENQGIDLGPRFGFAYDVKGDGRTAIRGGFGISVFTAEDSYLRGMVGNPPIQFTPTIYYGTVASLLNSGSTYFPTSVSGLARSGENQSFYNFSLSVQRDIGMGTVVDVGYVGTMGRHLTMGQNINQIPYGARFDPANQDPGYTTARSLPDNFMRPYLGYGGVNITQNGGTSSFHSLQAQAHRRMSRGLELDVVYVWSKTMDYSGSYPLYLARSFNYGKSDLDRTHNLKLAWVYQVPSLRGRVNSKLAWALFDNWQIAGMASFISGSPWGVGFSTTDGADLYGGGDGGRIIVLDKAALPHGERSFTRWFDPTVFARPATGDVGNAPKDIFRGPGINSWDVGIKRAFTIHESRQIEFRMDSYNFFNHTQFSSVNNSARFDTAGNQTNTQLGWVNGARAPRRMQAQLRFRF
jgi:hypothetical protein